MVVRYSRKKTIFSTGIDLLMVGTLFGSSELTDGPSDWNPFLKLRYFWLVLEIFKMWLTRDSPCDW